MSLYDGYSYEDVPTGKHQQLGREARTQVGTIIVSADQT